MGLQLAFTFTVVSFISVEQRGNTTGFIFLLRKSLESLNMSEETRPSFLPWLPRRRQKKTGITDLFYTNTNNHLPPTLNLKEVKLPITLYQTSIKLWKKWQSGVYFWRLMGSHNGVCRKRFIQKLRKSGFVALTAPGKQEQLDFHSLLQTLEHLKVIVSDVFKKYLCDSLADCSRYFKEPCST